MKVTVDRVAAVYRRSLLGRPFTFQHTRMMWGLFSEGKQIKGWEFVYFHTYTLARKAAEFIVGGGGSAKDYYEYLHKDGD